MSDPVIAPAGGGPTGPADTKCISMPTDPVCAGGPYAVAAAPPAAVPPIEAEPPEDRIGGIPDEHIGGGIPDEHIGGGIPDEHIGGFPDEHIGGGMPHIDAGMPHMGGGMPGHI